MNIKNYEKFTTVKEIKPKKQLDFIWKIMTGIFGFATFGLLGALFVKGTNMTWVISTFTFLFLFLGAFVFLLYLSKKTHAIMEFKATITGKPISLFFTDHKRVDWKVLEPEGNLLIDEQYGAFIINENGAYVDKKTKNVFLAFNPSIATGADMESFKITHALKEVLKDEKHISVIRKALMEGKVDGDDIVFEVNGKNERLSGFNKLKENIDFSHLKSLLNTIIPHAINSKIEMTIAQRTKGFGKVNTAQIILIVVAVIGATAIAIMLLKIYGGSGTTTIIKTVGGIAAQNASAVLGG